MEIRKDINGLRGKSFCFIYLYHLNQHLFKNGFFAVDIFILLSGYFSIYSHRTKSAIHYLANRLKRIIPVGYSVLYICHIIANNFIPKSRLEIIYNDIYSSYIGYTNIYFYKRSTNYFEDSIGLSINLHYWYYCLQEQLYIFCSLLIITTTFNVKKIVEISFFIYSILFSLFHYRNNINAVYYLFSSRVWEFLFGIFLFRSHIVICNTILSNLSVMIYIFTILFSYSNIIYIPFPTNSIYLIIASSILINKCDNALSSILFQFIGNLSFSLYLMHYPILFICKYNRLNNIIYICFFTISISYLLYICIERNQYIITLNSYKVFILFFLAEVSIVLRYNKIIYHLSYSKSFLTRTMAKKEWLILERSFKSFILTKCNSVILFMGDSHIMQWIPPILQNDNINYYNLIYIHYWINSIIYKNYSKLIKIISSFQMEYIIMSNLLANCSGCIIKQYTDLYNPFKLFILKLLYYTNNEIFILQDNPYHYMDVFVNPHDNYNYSYSILGVNCSVNYFPVFRFNKLKYIDTLKWICYNNRCNLFKNNYSVYIGNHHLTISFTMSLKNQLNEEIKFNKLKYIKNNINIYKYDYK